MPVTPMRSAAAGAVASASGRAAPPAASSGAAKDSRNIYSLETLQYTAAQPATAIAQAGATTAAAAAVDTANAASSSVVSAANSGPNLYLARQVTCDCSDCVRLNEFLRSQRRGLTLDVPSYRRQHIHEMVNHYIGNNLVSHVSRWVDSTRILYIEKIFDRRHEILTRRAEQVVQERLAAGENGIATETIVVGGLHGKAANNTKSHNRGMSVADADAINRLEKHIQSVHEPAHHAQPADLAPAVESLPTVDTNPADPNSNTIAATIAASNLSANHALESILVTSTSTGGAHGSGGPETFRQQLTNWMRALKFNGMENVVDEMRTVAQHGAQTRQPKYLQTKKDGAPVDPHPPKPIRSIPSAAILPPFSQLSHEKLLELEEMLLTTIRSVLHAYHARYLSKELQMNELGLIDPIANRVRIETSFRKNFKSDLESGVIRGEIIAQMNREHEARTLGVSTSLALPEKTTTQPNANAPTSTPNSNTTNTSAANPNIQKPSPDDAPSTQQPPSPRKKDSSDDSSLHTDPSSKSASLSTMKPISVSFAKSHPNNKSSRPSRITASTADLYKEHKEKEREKTERDQIIAAQSRKLHADLLKSKFAVVNAAAAGVAATPSIGSGAHSARAMLMQSKPVTVASLQPATARDSSPQRAAHSSHKVFDQGLSLLEKLNQLANGDGRNTGLKLNAQTVGEESKATHAATSHTPHTSSGRQSVDPSSLTHAPLGSLGIQSGGVVTTDRSTAHSSTRASPTTSQPSVVIDDVAEKLRLKMIHDQRLADSKRSFDLALIQRKLKLESKYRHAIWKFLDAHYLDEEKMVLQEADWTTSSTASINQEFQKRADEADQQLNKLMGLKLLQDKEQANASNNNTDPTASLPPSTPLALALSTPAPYPAPRSVHHDPSIEFELQSLRDKFKKKFLDPPGYLPSVSHTFDMKLSSEFTPQHLSFFPSFQNLIPISVRSTQHLQMGESEISRQFADTTPKLLPEPSIITMHQDQCVNITAPKLSEQLGIEALYKEAFYSLSCSRDPDRKCVNYSLDSLASSQVVDNLEETMDVPLQIFLLECEAAEASDRMEGAGFAIGSSPRKNADALSKTSSQSSISSYRPNATGASAPSNRNAGGPLSPSKAAFNAAHKSGSLRRPLNGKSFNLVNAIPLGSSATSVVELIAKQERKKQGRVAPRGGESDRREGSEERNRNTTIDEQYEQNEFDTTIQSENEPPTNSFNLYHSMSGSPDVHPSIVVDRTRSVGRSIGLLNKPETLPEGASSDSEPDVDVDQRKKALADYIDIAHEMGGSDEEWIETNVKQIKSDLDRKKKMKNNNKEKRKKRKGKSKSKKTNDDPNEDEDETQNGKKKSKRRKKKLKSKSTKVKKGADADGSSTKKRSSTVAPLSTAAEGDESAWNDDPTGWLHEGGFGPPPPLHTSEEEFVTSSDSDDDHDASGPAFSIRVDGPTRTMVHVPSIEELDAKSKLKSDAEREANEAATREHEEKIAAKRARKEAKIAAYAEHKARKKKARASATDDEDVLKPEIVDPVSPEGEWRRVRASRPGKVTPGGGGGAPPASDTSEPSSASEGEEAASALMAATDPVAIATNSWTAEAKKNEEQKQGDMAGWLVRQQARMKARSDLFQQMFTSPESTKDPFGSPASLTRALSSHIGSGSLSGASSFGALDSLLDASARDQRERDSAYARHRQTLYDAEMAELKRLDREQRLAERTAQAEARRIVKLAEKQERKRQAKRKAKADSEIHRLARLAAGEEIPAEPELIAMQREIDEEVVSDVSDVLLSEVQLSSSEDGDTTSDGENEAADADDADTGGNDDGDADADGVVSPLVDSSSASSVSASKRGAQVAGDSQPARPTLAIKPFTKEVAAELQLSTDPGYQELLTATLNATSQLLSEARDRLGRLQTATVGVSHPAIEPVSPRLLRKKLQELIHKDPYGPSRAAQTQRPEHMKAIQPLVQGFIAWKEQQIANRSDAHDASAPAPSSLRLELDDLRDALSFELQAAVYHTRAEAEKSKRAAKRSRRRERRQRKKEHEAIVAAKLAALDLKHAAEVASMSHLTPGAPRVATGGVSASPYDHVHESSFTSNYADPDELYRRFDPAQFTESVLHDAAAEDKRIAEEAKLAKERAEREQAIWEQTESLRRQQLEGALQAGSMAFQVSLMQRISNLWSALRLGPQQRLAFLNKYQQLGYAPHLLDSLTLHEHIGSCIATRERLLENIFDFLHRFPPTRRRFDGMTLLQRHAEEAFLRNLLRNLKVQNRILYPMIIRARTEFNDVVMYGVRVPPSTGVEAVEPENNNIDYLDKLSLDAALIQALREQDTPGDEVLNLHQNDSLVAWTKGSLSGGQPRYSSRSAPLQRPATGAIVQIEVPTMVPMLLSEDEQLKLDYLLEHQWEYRTFLQQHQETFEANRASTRTRVTHQHEEQQAVAMKQVYLSMDDEYQWQVSQPNEAGLAGGEHVLPSPIHAWGEEATSTQQADPQQHDLHQPRSFSPSRVGASGLHPFAQHLRSLDTAYTNPNPQLARARRVQRLRTMNLPQMSIVSVNHYYNALSRMMAGANMQSQQHHTTTTTTTTTVTQTQTRTQQSSTYGLFGKPLPAPNVAKFEPGPTIAAIAQAAAAKSLPFQQSLSLSLPLSNNAAMTMASSESNATYRIVQQQQREKLQLRQLEKAKRQLQKKNPPVEKHELQQYQFHIDGGDPSNDPRFDFRRPFDTSAVINLAELSRRTRTTQVHRAATQRNNNHHTHNDDAPQHTRVHTDTHTETHTETHSHTHTHTHTHTIVHHAAPSHALPQPSPSSSPLSDSQLSSTRPVSNGSSLISSTALNELLLLGHDQEHALKEYQRFREGRQDVLPNELELYQPTHGSPAVMPYTNDDMTNDSMGRRNMHMYESTTSMENEPAAAETAAAIQADANDDDAYSQADVDDVANLPPSHHSSAAGSGAGVLSSSSVDPSLSLSRVAAQLAAAIEWANSNRFPVTERQATRKKRVKKAKRGEAQPVPKKMKIPIGVMEYARDGEEAMRGDDAATAASARSYTPTAPPPRALAPFGNSLSGHATPRRPLTRSEIDALATAAFERRWQAKKSDILAGRSTNI